MKVRMNGETIWTFRPAACLPSAAGMGCGSSLPGHISLLQGRGYHADCTGAMHDDPAAAGRREYADLQPGEKSGVPAAQVEGRTACRRGRYAEKRRKRHPDSGSQSAVQDAHRQHARAAGGANPHRMAKRCSSMPEGDQWEPDAVSGHAKQKDKGPKTRRKRRCGG